MTVSAFAPAKINLTLHVTGQRADGYHLLDSLVAFADMGDCITVAPAKDLSLELTGPFAREVPVGADNLVLRAARFLHPDKGARITLDKRLPVAAGVGGGSADAAATLRALSQLWEQPLPTPADLVRLGADIPVCAGSEFARMQGVGEHVSTLPNAPKLRFVLINPLRKVSTPQVFSTLASKTNAAMSEPLPDAMGEARAFDYWLDWLRAQRNDLEAPAVALEPAIGTVLDALHAQPGCLLARMSGSGATCFAIMQEGVPLDIEAFRRAYPTWWVAETRSLGHKHRLDQPS